MTRSFLLAGAAVGLLLGNIPRTVLALDHEKGYGEPYELAGKRLVFTTWYWVRPGQHDWVNAAGKSVFADNKEMAGPFDARFINNDGPWGVRLIAEQAQRGKLAVKPEHPWEAGEVTIAQMLPTATGKIMAWGTCTDGKAEKERNCYLESSDGVNWLRPKLGLVEYDGSKQNNLIPHKPPGRVFIDPNGPEEERFKAASNGDMPTADFEKLRQKPHWRNRPVSMMALEDDPGRVDCINGYTSRDGLVWTEIEEPLTIEESDGDQIVYWDPKLKKYVMYARTYAVGSRAQGYPVSRALRQKTLGRRVIARSESADFRHFPLSEAIIEGSTEMGPTDSYYFSARTTIPGAPDFHLMFPTRYVIADDNTSLDLYTSYDGKVWHMAPGSPLLRTADFGQWDGGCIFAWPNLIERAGGDWLLLYKAQIFPHKYPRGRQTKDWGVAIWPKGRLMAIEASEKGGFTTPAFLAPGQKVRINALTSRVGEIRVEVADFDGKTLAGRSFADCIPIIGDQYRTTITWKGTDTLGVETGKPIVLRFLLEKAKIYSLDFE